MRAESHASGTLSGSSSLPGSHSKLLHPCTGIERTKGPAALPQKAELPP